MKSTSQPQLTQKIPENCLPQEIIKKHHLVILAKAYPSSEPDLKQKTKYRMLTTQIADGRIRLRPFNYNPMASGCVVLAALIKAANQSRARRDSNSH